MKVWNWIKGIWKSHGTKVLGAIGVALGTLAAMDPATLTAVLTALLGPRGPAISVIVIGLLTFYRGFRNTYAAKQVPPDNETEQGV